MAKFDVNWNSFRFFHLTFAAEKGDSKGRARIRTFGVQILGQWTKNCICSNF